jgi:hypothetical protein
MSRCIKCLCIDENDKKYVYCKYNNLLKEIQIKKSLSFSYKRDIIDKRKSIHIIYARALDFYVICPFLQKKIYQLLMMDQ